MYDRDVLEFFLDNQRRLFDEDVATTLEEAEEFLEEVLTPEEDEIGDEDAENDEEE